MTQLLEFKNKQDFEKILTKKELQKLEFFFEDIFELIGDMESLMSEIENENTLSYFESVKKKTKKYLIKKRIKPLIPIFKKILTSKQVLETLLYSDAKLFEHNFTKSEKLLIDYLNSFNKDERPKIFLLVGKFMVDYFHLTQSNLIEASSILKFEKSLSFEAKSLKFLEAYSVISENVYQRLIKFLLNCEYVRNNKKLNDNKKTYFGVVLNKLDTELNIKKYKPLILENAVLIRNAKNHGHRTILINDKKLKLWDKNGKNILFTENQMKTEFNRLIAFSFNNNILMIFINYLHKILLEEKVFDLIIDNLDDILLNLKDETKLKVIFEKNCFFRKLDTEFRDVFSLNLR